MSFRLKLFYIFTILIIFLFLLAGSLFFIQWKKFTTMSTISNLRSFSEINSNSITEICLKKMPNRSFFVNRKIYYIREKQPMLKGVFLVKSDGTMVYRFGNNNFKYENDLNDFISKSAIKFETTTKLFGKYLVVVVPYIDKWERHFYSDVFVYNMSSMYAAIDRYIVYFVLFESLLVIIAFIIGYWLSNMITYRLERLTMFARGLEKGDYDTPIELKGNDEFSKIASIMDESRKYINDYIEKLNSTIDKLKENNSMKDDFIANVSHELKTPLTSIIGYLDYLQNDRLGKLNKEQKKAVDKIQFNTLKLKKLIGSLLLVKNRYKDKLEHISLYEVMEKICKEYNAIIEERGLNLECKFDGYDYTILGDKEKLFSIFSHVIENAIKFTKEGYVRVIYSSMSDNKVKISIEDTGIGIPKDKIDKVFEKFVQLDVGRKRRFGGMGIGMFTVKEFIYDMSGTVRVESEQGKGSKVIIELPYVKRKKIRKRIF